MIIAMGAKAQLNSELSTDTNKWYNRMHTITEVTVSSKRQKYSRKNNPAVELMRKVIAAKKSHDIDNHDYFRYDRDQKVMMAVNDVNLERIDSTLIGKIPNVKSMVEPCFFNNKMILPLTFTETVTETSWRKHPSKELTVTRGERTEGLTTMFHTGDILAQVLRDFFKDVDIYDNQIHLLHNTFTSPIGRDAIAFYRFFIIDTLNVGTDRCVHLHFSPNNRQDFGFSGDIFVLDGSSYQVRRCVMNLPRQSGVNFVEQMAINQEFVILPDGSRALTTDDMVVELSLYDFIDKAVVIRNTRNTNHSFDAIADEAFEDKRKVDSIKVAKQKDDLFWHEVRPLALTESESRMSSFFESIKSHRWYAWVSTGLKLLIENYIDTGTKNHPSKVDIGPINTFVSSNFVDGLRTRIGAQTTAHLMPQFFLKGYYAHGWDSKKDYWKGEATFSLNRKEYSPNEFPMRNIILSTSYDVCSPSDKYMTTDKDNVFTSMKWTDVDMMIFSRTNQLKLVREEYSGLRTTLQLTSSHDTPCGDLNYVTLSRAAKGDMSSEMLKTTEIKLELRYAPGEKTVVTKQRRKALNHEVPVFTLSHAVGINGLLGGQYNYNITEASYYQRYWLNSWGKLDFYLKAGAQWNQVPFPLLIMPAANLSYIIQPATFNLINNMEFLNDRYASIDAEWDINGKIFNRVPLVKKLKWREYLGVKMLWGYLTDKNNPYLEANRGSDMLMQFPQGSNIMNPDRPYLEIVAGVHNVFRFFRIEYVRRLNYLDLPTAEKHGIRIMFKAKF